eukprot:9273569-Lingulodinium_polyedra.AAC.1
MPLAPRARVPPWGAVAPCRTARRPKLPSSTAPGATTNPGLTAASPSATRCAWGRSARSGAGTLRSHPGASTAP